jgi:pyruvate dehydrogenase E2 component (dihydrolipoamide acetyltransferase)
LIEVLYDGNVILIKRRIIMQTMVKVPKIIEKPDLIKLVAWYVKDHDFVKEETALCVLETSKASFEVGADRKGFVKLLKKEGDMVLVDDNICIIADSAEELGNT